MGDHMNRTLQPAVSFFAVGLLGLGVLALVYHDFALVWQAIRVVGAGPHRSGLRFGRAMLACGVGYCSAPLPCGRSDTLSLPHPLDASQDSRPVRRSWHGGGVLDLAKWSCS